MLEARLKILRLDSSNSGLLHATYSYTGDFDVENFSQMLKQQLKITDNEQNAIVITPKLNGKDQVCAYDIFDNCNLFLERHPKSVLLKKNVNSGMLKWFIGFEDKFLEMISKELIELNLNGETGKSKKPEQLKDEAIANACRKYLGYHITKHFTVVEKAGWILKKEGTKDDGTREHDILIIHSDTSFTYPPVGSRGPFNNDVKAKFYMVPDSSVITY